MWTAADWSPVGVEESVGDVLEREFVEVVGVVERSEVCVDDMGPTKGIS